MADDDTSTDRADGPSRPRSRSRAAAGSRRKATTATETGRSTKRAPVTAKEAGGNAPAPTATPAQADTPEAAGDAAPAARKKAAPRPSKRTGGSSKPRTVAAPDSAANSAAKDSAAKDSAAKDRAAKGRDKPSGGEARKKDQRSGNPKKAAAAAELSKRYTAPVPRESRVSPWWVPALLFGLLGSGMIVIFLNYLLWDARPLGLGVGLGLILGGILTATQYR